jgi:hypothetical protein
MSEAAIFIYGLAVFAIVAAACGLIVFGIVEERRSREQLDAGPDARDPGLDKPERGAARLRDPESTQAEGTR